MPELPEVETVVRDLQPRLVGRTIVSVRASKLPLRRRWSSAWAERLKGRCIEAVRRRGKWIIAELDDGGRLVIHLGMTGQLTVVPASAPRQGHTHLRFALGGNADELRFRDIRRFGSATLFASEEEVARFFQESGLGPEPFNLDPRYWRRRLAKTGRCLKAVLLDQQVVAGVGNIYADESLFAARLHPARLARDLSAAEARRLRGAIVAVLTRAIDRRGSSIRNYVGGSGGKGAYQEEFRVYGRSGQACPRCRRPIARLRLAGRATHFCPECQK